MIATLLMSLVLMGQSPSDFDMIAKADDEYTLRVKIKPQAEITAPQVIIKTVEIPVYYKTDDSGQEWYDRDKSVLDRRVAAENGALRTARKGRSSAYVEGADRLGRTWRASSQEQLNRDLARANSEVVSIAPQRVYNVQVQPWSTQSLPRRYYSAPMVAGGCFSGQCGVR